MVSRWPASDPEHVAFLAAFAAALHAPRSELLCKPRPAGVSIERLRLGFGFFRASLAGDTPDLPGADTIAGIAALMRERAARWTPSVQESDIHAQLRQVIDVCGRPPDAVLHFPRGASRSFESLRDGGTRPLLVFHGTPFENVWSILNFGFINAAQVSPQLGRHGQARGAFGQGIYFSVEPGLAASYVRPSQPLPSDLGQWRCLLICEVAPGPMVTVGGQEQLCHVGGREALDVPDGYVVVEDSESVAVRAAVFWHSEARGGACTGAWQLILAAILVIAIVFYQMWVQMPPALRRRRFGF